uniref:Uncharacterized protein n=1 Tax=Tetranychus urticae TaxID=32264 RepID=T1KIV2_TETUR
MEATRATLYSIIRAINNKKRSYNHYLETRIQLL